MAATYSARPTAETIAAGTNPQAMSLRRVSVASPEFRRSSRSRRARCTTSATGSQGDAIAENSGPGQLHGGIEGHRHVARHRRLEEGDERVHRARQQRQSQDDQDFFGQQAAVPRHGGLIHATNCRGGARRPHAALGAVSGTELPPSPRCGVATRGEILGG